MRGLLENAKKMKGRESPKLTQSQQIRADLSNQNKINVFKDPKDMNPAELKEF